MSSCNRRPNKIDTLQCSRYNSRMDEDSELGTLFTRIIIVYCSISYVILCVTFTFRYK